MSRSAKVHWRNGRSMTMINRRGMHDHGNNLERICSFNCFSGDPTISIAMTPPIALFIREVGKAVFMGSIEKFYCSSVRE